MINEEIKRRINVSVWAYAYEFENVSLVSDEYFDYVCKLINPELQTGNLLMDKFFKEEFSPYTGQWIRSHPELHKVKYLYENYYKKKTT